jgi:hypothetical protein
MKQSGMQFPADVTSSIALATTSFPSMARHFFTSPRSFFKIRLFVSQVAPPRLATRSSSSNNQTSLLGALAIEGPLVIALKCNYFF